MEELAMRKKLTVMFAVMGSLLFVALNQTIVATSIPKILADIGGIQYFNWVFTAYMVSSSVTAIVVGKLSDIYGRKPFILIGLTIFSIGTFLNGLSSTIFHLIVYRCIQGFGAGMIMSTSFTAIGDLFAPRERGRWQGLMGATFGVASIFGPTLGGYIVDYFAWQWVFWIFLPFGLIAFALILWLFPWVKQEGNERIDYLGVSMLVLTIVPMLLALSWAGTDYAWLSKQVMSLFIVSLVCLGIFIVVEMKAESPVLPLFLFKNSVFTISNAVSFIIGFGMFGTFMFLPLFMQGVIGTTAMTAGFVMMTTTLSHVIGGAVGGQLVTKTGKYKRLALFGLFIMCLGLLSISSFHQNTSMGIIIATVVVFGLGLGIYFPIFTVTVQNAVEHRLLGVATSSTQFFRQLGGTVGVSLMGTVMNIMTARHVETIDQMVAESSVPELIDMRDSLRDTQLLMEHERLDELREGLSTEGGLVLTEIINFLRESLKLALNSSFFLTGIIVLCGFLLTFFLKELPLRTTNK